ncbi:Uncharacterised protein [Mycobacteroides abscessus subsp. massiliense]|nr:Uncharacterised protein [Mycobacteroides abscessus subsp. massiliense]
MEVSEATLRRMPIGRVPPAYVIVWQVLDTAAGRYSWLAPDQALLSMLTGGALLVALSRL